MAGLPTELYLSILEQLIPFPPPIALSPSDPVTKALLALARTSRLFYKDAIRLLYSHCVYIDGPDRLHQICFSLFASIGQKPTHYDRLPFETIYFSGEPTLYLDRVQVGDFFTKYGIPVKDQPNTLPIVQPHTYITSIYLCPCPPSQSTYSNSLKDLPTAHSIYSLMSLVKQKLRRLVVDAPTSRPFQDEDDHNIRLALRISFLSLPVVEYFASLRDAFYLDCYFGLRKGRYRRQSAVWYDWPCLKTLALYPCSNKIRHVLLWNYLGHSPLLENLILVGSPQLGNLKSKWRSCCTGEPRGLNILLLGTSSNHITLVGQESWEDDEIVVQQLIVSDGDMPAVSSNVEREMCKQIMEKRIMSGTPEVNWRTLSHGELLHSINSKAPP